MRSDLCLIAVSSLEYTSGNLLSLIYCDYATATVDIPSSFVAYWIRSSAVAVDGWNLLDGWARRGK